MKKISLTGLALTLLMLLFVLLAAFIFLFQGRQKVIEQRDGLESKTAVLQQNLDQTEDELTAVAATDTETAAALATAETSSLLLEGELVQSQQKVDALTEQLDAASQIITTLKTEQEAVLSQPPKVAILSPANGNTLPLGELVEIVMVATDAKGFTSVNLTINDGIVETYQPGNETLFTAVAPWEPAAVGAYGIQLTAVNSEGIRSSSSMITVTVAADSANRGPNDANAELRRDIDGWVSGLRQLAIPDGVNQILVPGVLLR
jgi:Bacterial Ig domain